MDKSYIAPEVALRKLRAARGLQQTIYIYGATGYGKTELVRQYLSNRRYQYFSCREDREKPEEIFGFWPEREKGAGKPREKRNTKDQASVIVVDDLHLLKSEEGRAQILETIGRGEVWLILIGRSPMPLWLMQTYVKEGFLIVTEEDLRLKKKEIAEYFERQQLSFTEEEAAYVWEQTQGNGYVVRHTALKMQEGKRPGPQLTQEIQEAFVDYLESCILVEWDSDLLEFLMKISVVEEFTLPMAELVSGDSRVSELLERALEAGNFLTCEEGVYRLRPELVGALRKRAAKVFGSDKMADYAYNAGLYYEMHDQIVPALVMFEQCGRKERVKDLLIRNARLNPGNGHYFELRRYYLQMREEEVEESAVLMAGMSMLYSLLLQEGESEYWYDKLKLFVQKTKGGQRREALSRLVYLDIALPHRGSIDMLEIMKRVPSLLFERGIRLPEFSVTSNCPSTMNGGKDFCHWSIDDRKLAVTVGRLVERVLGRYGKGLVKAALGESLYEKGGDTYEILTLLTRAQMETEGGGMMEIEFAAVGLQVRLNVFHGEMQTAKALLSAFEGKVREQGALQLLPNIAALKCRLALYEGDRNTVETWMETAPDEKKEFYVMERYRYLTKVRCYIFAGAYLEAQSLLEKLRYYAEKFHRIYIRMEVNLLSAIVKQRMGGEWKEDFLAALKGAGKYRFFRLISEEGAAVKALFASAGRSFLEQELPDKEWFSRLLLETGEVAVRYPVYLKRQLAQMPDFCETALAILRLQAEGLSVNQISERLSMKAATVKYHTKENYRKLGVSGKTDAVLAARNLGIL